LAIQAHLRIYYIKWDLEIFSLVEILIKIKEYLIKLIYIFGMLSKDILAQKMQC